MVRSRSGCRPEISICGCCGGIVRGRLGYGARSQHSSEKIRGASTASRGVEINAGAVCAKQLTIYESVFFSEQNAGVRGLASSMK